jgi:hypothetical protein
VVEHLRGWVDYDRPDLPALQGLECVDYFEKRVDHAAVAPLKRLMDHEILLADSSALLVYGVAICCAAETEAPSSSQKR